MTNLDTFEVGFDIPAMPGMNEADIQTLCLVLDLDALERNIRKMGQYARAHGMRLARFGARACLSGVTTSKQNAVRRAPFALSWVLSCDMRIDSTGQSKHVGGLLSCDRFALERAAYTLPLSPTAMARLLPACNTQIIRMHQTITNGQAGFLTRGQLTFPR